MMTNFYDKYNYLEQMDKLLDKYHLLKLMKKLKIWLILYLLDKSDF